MDYNRDVRPILAEKCYPCHGPDKKARKAKLRLDDFAAAVKAGAITPGKPDESELVERIFSDDPDERMPPKKSKTILDDKAKEVLRKWIAAGAQTSRHWAFVPPKRPEVPVTENASWPRNAIDRFILARLEVNYLVEMHFPGRVRIGTNVTDLGATSVSLSHGLFNKKICSGTGKSIVVNINSKSRRPELISEHLRDQLLNIKVRGL